MKRCHCGSCKSSGTEKLTVPESHTALQNLLSFLHRWGWMQPSSCFIKCHVYFFWFGNPNYSSASGRHWVLIKVATGSEFPLQFGHNSYIIHNWKKKKKKVCSQVKPPWLSKQAPISFLHNCDLLLNNKCTLCKIGFEFSQLMLICKSTATSLTIKITSFMAEIRPSGFQVRKEESSSPAFRAKLRNGTCIQSTYWALPETIGSLKLYLQEEESNPFFWTRYYKDPFLLEPHSDSPLAVGTSTCCPVTLSAPTRTRNTLCPWGTGQPLSPIQHEAGPILGLISHDFSAVRAQRKTVNRSIFLNWGLTWSGKKKNKSSWTKRKGNKQLCCLILKAFSCAAGEWWSTASSESC